MSSLELSVPSGSDRLPNQPGNIAGLLIRAAHQHPHTGMLLLPAEPGREAVFLTYPALLDQAERILGGLTTLGCRPGAKVAVLLERPLDFIPLFWACVLGGYVPCPLVPMRHDRERWSKHLAHVDRLLDHPLLVTTRALKRELPGVAAVELDTLRDAAPREPTREPQATELAVLVLTSGSTGNSKAVELTHGNLLASMSGKMQRQRLTTADVTLNWISFDHVAALLETHLLPLYAGASQVHVEPTAILADPLQFLRLIHRYRVSMTFAPNFLFGHINAALQPGAFGTCDAAPAGLDLSCLRHIISGGEAVVIETAHRFLELLGPYGLARSALWPAFGMTETCAGSVYSAEFPDSDAGREFASLGLPIAGLHLRIVNDGGYASTSGETGELQLRGPMVFCRYHNNEEATHAAFTADGWFRSGDLGRIEAGRLSLVGRSKDSILVNGSNYFGHELEAALEQLNGIERSFVAAFPTRPQGADTEQLVIAFAPCFALADESRLHQLIVAIRNTTILLWGFRPALILPLPKHAFPKTSLGKIQRASMRKRLETGDFAADQAKTADITRRQHGEYVAPQGPAETAVTGIFAEMFGHTPATVSAASSFFDLGGTSLEIVTLRQKLERYFNRAALPLVTILQNPSPRAIAASICGESQHQGSGYDPVVPLQLTGNKTPLFCIHAATGEVLVFVSLANYFVNERPIYALRARGFQHDEVHFATFAEMVDTYVAAIRRRQPHGPYAIAGYSYGGPVAFEIARALESAGERVAFISSIDGTPVIGNPAARFQEIDSTVVLAFFLSLIDRTQMEKLPDMLSAARPARDPCAYLIGIAPPRRLVELDLDLPKFRAWAQLAHSLVRVGESYVPSGTVESVTVFYADPLSGTKERWLNEQLRSWDGLARVPNRYIPVAGEHHTLLGPRHIASFQSALRAEMDRALGGR